MRIQNEVEPSGCRQISESWSMPKLLESRWLDFLLCITRQCTSYPLNTDNRYERVPETPTQWQRGRCPLAHGFIVGLSMWESNDQKEIEFHGAFQLWMCRESHHWVHDSIFFPIWHEDLLCILKIQSDWAEITLESAVIRIWYVEIVWRNMPISSFDSLDHDSSVIKEMEKQIRTTSFQNPSSCN